MTKLSLERAISTKSVKRDAWSPTHIEILIDSSQCYYLPTVQVSLRLAEKWPMTYHKRATCAIHAGRVRPVFTVNMQF